MYVANIPEEFTSNKIILTDARSGQGRSGREAALGRCRSAELRPAAESESEIRALKRETAAAEVQLRKKSQGSPVDSVCANSQRRKIILQEPYRRF